MQIISQISILAFVWSCKKLSGGLFGLHNNSVYFLFLVMPIYVYIQLDTTGLLSVKIKRSTVKPRFYVSEGTTKKHT
jgi:hypothetical protein